MKYLPLFTLFALIWASCKDDLPPSVPQAPAPPLEEVEVFAPCDLSESGEASAIKISAEWKATAKCRNYYYLGKKYWIIEMFTCSDFNEFREVLAFARIPDINATGKYSFAPEGDSIAQGQLRARYNRVTDDGDVPDDYYYYDTTALNDYFIIDSWDTLSRQIEGRFKVSYIVRQPRLNPENPEKVKFWKGKFRLPLRD